MTRPSLTVLLPALTLAGCATAPPADPVAFTSTLHPLASERVVDLSLVAAIANERLDAVRVALDQGADPNAWVDYEFSLELPLVLATVGEGTEVLKCLLEHGADPNGFDAEGNSALLGVARNGSVEQVELLLDYGARPTVLGTLGESALHEAAAANNLKALELLLARGVPTDLRDQCERTAFLEACRSAQREAIVLLAEHGADVHAVDHSEASGLLLAGFRHPEVLECLLQLGLDPTRTDSRGRALIHCLENAPSPAVAEACLDVLRKHGVNLAQRDGSGLTVSQRLEEARRVKERKQFDAIERINRLLRLSERALGVH